MLIYNRWINGFVKICYLYFIVVNSFMYTDFCHIFDSVWACPVWMVLWNTRGSTIFLFWNQLHRKVCTVSNVLKYTHCIIFAASTKQVLTSVKNCFHDMLLPFCFCIQTSAICWVWCGHCPRKYRNIVVKYLYNIPGIYIYIYICEIYALLNLPCMTSLVVCLWVDCLLNLRACMGKSGRVLDSVLYLLVSCIVMNCRLCILNGF